MSHVECVDYLSRWVDPVSGCLHTERLITCSQPIPSFIARIFMLDVEGSYSYFLERSVVDPRGRRTSLLSRNLTLSSLLSVEERCSYTGTTNDHGNKSITKFDQYARITSYSSWAPIREAVEDFCLSRCSANSDKGRAALLSAINRLSN